MPIDPDIADQFKAAGLWRTYIEQYEANKDAGHKMGEARSMAIAKVVTDAGLTLRMPGDPAAPAPDNGEVELAPQTPSPSEDLVDGAVFANKSCSVLEAHQWVADSLWIKGVEPEHAPSPAAWGLLLWSRSSPTCRSDFYKTYSRLIPSRAELREHEPFHDDGRDLTKSPFYIWLTEKYGPQSAEVKEYEDEPRLPMDPQTKELLAVMDKLKAGTGPSPNSPGAFMGVCEAGLALYRGEHGPEHHLPVAQHDDAA